jgi:hypothetical protein
VVYSNCQPSPPNSLSLIHRHHRRRRRGHRQLRLTLPQLLRGAHTNIATLFSRSSRGTSTIKFDPPPQYSSRAFSQQIPQRRETESDARGTVLDRSPDLDILVEYGAEVHPIVAAVTVSEFETVPVGHPDEGVPED